MFLLRPAALLLVALAAVAGSAPGAIAAETTLSVVDTTGGAHDFAIETLLARPDAVTITVPGDPAYGNETSTYRAIPLAGLLSGLLPTDADILKATALDGFVAQLPAAKAVSTDPAGATAYLAIEDPKRPWPNLPGKDVSAGPYYVVWLNPQRSGIKPEAWPYQTIRLELTTSVERRYPQILVDSTLPDDAPARRGEKLFVDNCFVCHRMNGGGDATVGPDLNLPMNPTEYFRISVLPRYIRDPASVRHWSDQKMPSFGPDVLSDSNIADIIAYLGHMTGRR